MKKKSLLILLVGVLALLVVTGIGTTYAWLTQEGNDQISYTVGEVNYTIDLAEKTTELVVPGQDVTPTLTITNSSNISTQIRVSFTIEKTDGDANVNWTIGTADTNHLKLTLNANWVYENGYYYYKGSDNTDEANKVASTTTSLDSLFDALVINGAVVGNTESGAKITIKMHWEAKQADYVKWSEMGTIDFKTGLAKTN